MGQEHEAGHPEVCKQHILPDDPLIHHHRWTEDQDQGCNGGKPTDPVTAAQDTPEGGEKQKHATDQIETRSGNDLVKDT